MTAHNGPARDGPVQRVLRRVRRALLWHPRLIAAVLAATAVAAGFAATRPPPTETVPAVTAARDLPAGARVSSSDVGPAQVAPGSLPSGALRDARAVVGRTTAGPVRRGEVLTDVRLLGASMLDGYGPDLVASPVALPTQQQPACCGRATPSTCSRRRSPSRRPARHG